jgi:hypothetical protein
VEASGLEPKGYDGVGLLADLLNRNGRVEEALTVLRARIDEGDSTAGFYRAELLAVHGRADELQAEVNAGTLDASHQLNELLVRQGQLEQAKRLRTSGLNPDGSIASSPPNAADSP